MPLRRQDGKALVIILILGYDFLVVENKKRCVVRLDEPPPSSPPRWAGDFQILEHKRPARKDLVEFSRGYDLFGRVNDEGSIAGRDVPRLPWLRPRESSPEGFDTYGGGPWEEDIPGTWDK
jgi:hypothetical protein